MQNLALMEIFRLHWSDPPESNWALSRTAMAQAVSFPEPDSPDISGLKLSGKLGASRQTPSLYM